MHRSTHAGWPTRHPHGNHTCWRPQGPTWQKAHTTGDACRHTDTLTGRCMYTVYILLHPVLANGNGRKETAMRTRVQRAATTPLLFHCHYSARNTQPVNSGARSARAPQPATLDTERPWSRSGFKVAHPSPYTPNCQQSMPMLVQRIARDRSMRCTALWHCPLWLANFFVILVIYSVSLSTCHFQLVDLGAESYCIGPTQPEPPALTQIVCSMARILLPVALGLVIAGVCAAQAPPNPIHVLTDVVLSFVLNCNIHGFASIALHCIGMAVQFKPRTARPCPGFPRCRAPLLRAFGSACRS